MQAVMTVTGPDKPGIIAKVTGILYQADANLEDISMTVLEGEFAMIVIAGFELTKTGKEIERTLKHFAERNRLSITWRVLRRRLKPGKKHQKGSRSFILSAVGCDKTGIVHKVSRLFQRHKLNITDLNSKLLAGRKKPLYILMLEVDLPRGFRKAAVDKEIKKLGEELEIDIQFRPVQHLEM